MAQILIIDDDHSLREVVAFILTDQGHQVVAASSGEEGLEAMSPELDLVISDIRMPGIDGMEVLRRIRNLEDPPPVIMLTAHGTVDQAVEAMTLGAFTYLLKPFARDELRITVEQAIHSGRLERDNARLRARLEQRSSETGLIYRSPEMESFLDQLKRVAPADATVLVTGESGTGKELVARACHDLSDRWEQPFVAVNCGAIPAELIESELFGHARGAFTGADRAFTGRIRSADRGTLFLDEIAELPLGLQPKLLRVLETRLVDPVGSASQVSVDFRLVCATNRDLATEVAAGRFREDLLFRINVLHLDLPPLRERSGDVPLLWEYFTRLHGGGGVETDDDLLAELSARAWPGNVRELKNLNQRLVLMRQEDTLTKQDLERLTPDRKRIRTDRDSGSDVPGGLDLGPLPEAGLSLIELEKEVIRRALAHCGGNRSKTATYLGVPRHFLVYRIRKYGLD